jgi:hypothetical protein
MKEITVKACNLVWDSQNVQFGVVDVTTAVKTKQEVMGAGR